jgi:hypothetical protein
MALKLIGPQTNGSALRKYPSWIDAFVEYTGKFLESGELFRKWGAISALAAVLEQKVWTTSGNKLFPNLYVFLIGSTGIGKSRVMDNLIEVVSQLPDYKDNNFLGPTSMSKASMIDIMDENKRTLLYPTEEYNTMYAIIDEFSTLMSKWDSDIVAALTKFYDCNTFKEAKRMNDLRKDIRRPQMNLLTGSTAPKFLEIVKDSWGQGLMSRVILVHTQDKDLKDCRVEKPPMEGELVHDLLVISKVRGEIRWTDGYGDMLHSWRLGGCLPIPQHPYLEDYIARRDAHLRKLSMVACIDRGGPLELTTDDFRRALGWMIEVEQMMPAIFSQGTATTDSRAHDEIEDFVRRHKLVSQSRLIRFVSQRVRTAEILKTIDIMIHGGRIARSEEEPYTFSVNETKE